ncbi:MAG: hypothetical protein SGJ13_08550 [Actinomycetota bacterium]|nr:hypothetical protein [Actinomycetota bacterium]
MRISRIVLFMAALAVAAPIAGATAAEAATEDLVVSLDGGTLVVTDHDTNSGYLYVVQDYKLILDSDSGAYSVGPGCRDVDGEIWHPQFEHYDYSYVVCAGWDNDHVRGNMGEGYDTVDFRDSPGPLTATFDLGTDGDYYYGTDGTDVVHGGADSDELWGYGGDDELYGDEDGDELHPGTGSDFVDGGNDEWNSDDSVSYADVAGKIEVKYTYPSGTAREGGSVDQLRNLETIFDSPAGDKIVAGGTASTTVYVYTSGGRDLVTSLGNLWISSESEKNERDRINIRNVSAGSGSRSGMKDTLDCNGVRPSSIQYDRGMDTLESC